MTESITVAIAPEAKGIRILAQRRDNPLLQALLKPVSPWALRALPALLEALADYQAMPLSVVLCADESGTSILSEALTVLQRESAGRWPVGLAVVPSRRHHRDIDWDRRFDDLRLLHIEGSRS
jgi:hypothetical protein